MTRTSLKLLALVGVVFAACNKTQPPGTPTVAFTDVSDQQTLAPDAGTTTNGILTITVTAQESGFTTQPLCELFVDGVEAQKNVAASTSGTVTFSGVQLSGGSPPTGHTLKIICTDLSGQTATAGPITVSVGLGSTGACGLTIVPADSTVFNETGTQVTGAVQDSNLTAAGIQATLQVLLNQDGGACPDGLVSLTYDNGDGGLTSPTSVTSQNGVATFARITLPETTAAALGNVSKQLEVTAAVDLSSVTVHYVVDSVDPSCTIVAPANGATITLADDIDSSTAGIQVMVSGTCTGIAGTTPTFNVVDAATGATYGTVVDSGDAQGSFTGTITLNNGTDKITLTGSSVTGNPITSTTSIVTVSTICPTPTLSITAPTANQVFNLADDANFSQAGFQLLLHLPTNAPISDDVEICSSVAPSTGAVACPFGTGAFLVGQANPSGGIASPTVTLGDDGAAASQTLTAQVVDPCGTATAQPVTITVHALTPVIDTIVVQNDFVDDGGQIWLNNADLQAGGAATDVVLTADAADVFASDGGAAVTIKNAQGQTVFIGTGFFSLGPPPTATVPISGLADGPYTVTVTATDIYGNPSDSAQGSPVSVTFTIFVKTSLPTCTISGPPDPNGCFNIHDNNNTAANGAVAVPIVVTASNASFDDNGSTLDGTAAVTVAAGGQASGVIANVATISASSPQGTQSYSATVTDAAGNPSASCTPAAVNVNVSTVAPSLTATPQGGGAADTAGCATYTVRDGILIDFTNISLANGANLTVYATGSNGGSTARTSATVANGAASATLNGLPNGDDALVVTGADSCGNSLPANGVCVGINAPGCDLSLVSPVATVTDAGESVVLNATQVDVNGNGAVQLHTSCAAGTQVQFDSTASGGSDVPLDGGVDANGNITFDLTGLVDGSTGTFTADISGGEALPTIDYDAKLSLPTFTSETPAAGTLEIVANQDNLVLSDAGVTSLPITGGTIVANEAQCTTTACADFTMTGISGLGPVDGSGNIGTATLALTGFTKATANPNPISIASGTTTVTFTAVSLPAVDTGTVTLTLTDNVGNTTSAAWTVTTDSLQPQAPSLVAVMSDKRTASVKLSWTVPPTGGDSATQGYELAYNVYPLNTSPPATPSEVNYGTWTLDPNIASAGLSTTAGTAVSYVASNLPTLNQYTFELRAIDAVGNRSPLAADATAADVSSTDTNAWQTVTITDNTDTNDIQDFGYLLRSGDFNGDGKQDLAIAAPSRFGAGTPGIVYVMNGAANLSTVTFAGLSSITLGGANNDYFGLAMHVADYNQDGVDDLAVGAPVYNNDQGRVDIFYGHNPGGLSATPDVTILGDSTDTGLFGHGIGTADVNGDGVPDLLIGAPGTSSGSGALYVFVAPAAGAWALPDAGLTFATATSAISGNAGDGLGAHWGIADLGDIDADGKDDIAVGAPGGGGTDGLDAGPGHVYGFTGKSIVNTATMNTSNALFDLTNGTTFCDPTVYGYASSVGDVQDTTWGCFGLNVIGKLPGNVSFTGAALPDLIVSSGYNTTVYLFTMTATGPNTPAAVGDSDLTPGSVMGWSVAAFDINGDGKPDILSGENNASTPASPDNVFLFLNTGNTLSATTSGEIFGPTNGDYYGYGVWGADFQGSGKQDFAISEEYPLEYVNVYY